MAKPPNSWLLLPDSARNVWPRSRPPEHARYIAVVRRFAHRQLTGTAAAVADHYGVPRHTAQSWIRTLRRNHSAAAIK